MVLRLCRALGAPSETVNSILASAGYADEYPSRPLDAAELAPFVDAAGRLLDSHDPYPGWLVDPDWRIVRANRAGASIMALLGLEAEGGLVEAVIQDPTLGGVVVNLRESAFYLQHRLTAEARRRGCARTAGLAGRLNQVTGDFNEPASNSPATPTVLLGRVDKRLQP